MQVEKSEELQCLLQVYAQETTVGEKKYDHCRSKLMSQRRLEQKIKDSQCSQREIETKTDVQQELRAEGSRKEKAKKIPKTIPREECIRWIATSQCPFGEASAFEHDLDQKGKGKERLRSLSPTISPRRNSQLDAKSGDDGCMKETQKLTGSSPSGKANKQLCTNSKKSCCQIGNSRNYLHVRDCTKIKAPSRCRFRDKCAYKHTRKPAAEKQNSASIAIHIPSNDERQMQIRRISRMTNPKTE